MTTIQQTDHVLYALERLGHENLADAAADFVRRVREHGFSADGALTVKTDGITLRIAIKPQEETDLPLLDGQ